MTVADLDRLAILAGRSWHVADLPGGLTNHNVRVTTDDDGPPLDVVVRCSQSDAGLLGIDRDAEHVNTPRAARGRGGRAGASSTGPTSACWSSASCAGTALDDDDFADAGVLSRGRGRLPPAARRARGSPATSTCSRGRRPTSRPSGSAASRCRRRTTTTPTPGPTYAGRSRPRPRPTVPCNNDLLAANFIDDGDRVWLIDYEYSGNNDACFELGNTSTECDFTPEQTEAWTEAYFGDAHAAPTSPGSGCRRCAAQYGWSLWGFIQAATSPHGLRLPRLGDGALREGRGDVPRTRTSTGCSTEAPRD